jgi:hypothetical protein
MKNIFALLVVGSLALTACVFRRPGLVSPTGFTPFPQPTATPVKVFPTSSSPSDSITWDNLQVTMDQLEITQEYLTDFGSTRVPTEGNKFLWVHIRLKNTGQIENQIPTSEHFSILYAAVELKPTYGHRADYTDYTTLGPIIFPGQELDGWLRFDIPATSELNELRFVFIPKSSQVGSSYSSPNYPYSDDKPTFVWKCAL